MRRLLVLPIVVASLGVGVAPLVVVGCGNDAVSMSDASTPDAAGGDAPAVDAVAADAADALAYPDPLAGTTKAATLIKNGFTFTEGPVWLSGALIFSDESGGNTLWQLTPPQTFTLFRMPSNNANGNAVDSANRLVTCEQSTHRLTRTDGAVITTIASAYNGKSFNSPNDVIVRADGTVYFTDPDYAANNADRQPYQGVFRIDPAMAVSLVASDMSEPNGIALSPDETLLYVDDTNTGQVRVFTLASDGTASNARPFVSTGATPDGMAVDDAGNLYVSTATGIEVYDASGATLGTITVPEQPANCTFGGADRKTLFITARTGVYSIALNVPGKP